MEAEFQDYETNRKWIDIFNVINIRARAEKLSTRDSTRNRHLNRYMDVVPYDSTRVKIERNSLNYINASHVNVPAADRKFILTQGPLKHTSGHFWAMVWEQNTKGILMLNRVVEGGNIKCHQYWPNGEDNGDEDEMVFEDVGLKVSLLSWQRKDAYIFRRLQVTDLYTDESRTVFHFHYILWPDFDLPESADSFLQYLEAVRASGCLDSAKYGPTVIHCSAGIGRSGTFVLVDVCLYIIEKNQCRDSINIIDILLEMRKCRMGLIQTAGQLRFSFQAIIEGSKRLLNLNGSSAAVGDNDSDKSSQKNLMRMLGVPDDSSGTAEDDDDDSSTASGSIRKFADFEKEKIQNNNKSHPKQYSDDDDDDDEDGDDDEQEVVYENDTEETGDVDKKDKDDTPVVDEERVKRDAAREERRKSMMEAIQRVKRKKAEEEERLAFKTKLIKYLTPITVAGVAVFIGLYFLPKKHDFNLFSS